jgi:hypothetical protein
MEKYEKVEKLAKAKNMTLEEYVKQTMTEHVKNLL